MRGIRLIGTRGLMLEVLVPETGHERLRGLLGRSSLNANQAMLFERASSIHTFGMRFPITVALLDRRLIVRRVVTVRPRRLVLPRPGVRHVLECAEGTDLRLRDRLRVLVGG